ncbi:phage Gp37/Gp68 family protein [Streptomyces hydrogenans]
MSDTTTIEWTDTTWNPVSGCTKISAGCDHCYAETIAERFRGTAAFPRGFDVQLRPDKVNAPLTWRKPRRVFVNSMSDLFHADVDQSWITDIFAVIAAARRHTFQLLTKRHARMRHLLNDPTFVDHVRSRAHGKGLPADAWQWPLPNLWLGVSVENQQWADIRIPALLDTPAAIRWISAEPLLGPVDLTQFVGQEHGLDWVVAGGESGTGARPAHPDWFRSLRDQCATANVPFFFKQYGAWHPTGWLVIGGPREKNHAMVGDPVDNLGHRVEVQRVGKKAAGRHLDGRTHDDYPAIP